MIGNMDRTENEGKSSKLKFYLTEKNTRLSVLSLTDGADISSLVALTPRGCCACTLRNNKKNLLQYGLLHYEHLMCN